MAATPAHDVEEVPGLDDLADAVSPCARATRPGASSVISARSPSSRRSRTAGRRCACSKNTCRTSRSPSAFPQHRDRDPRGAVATQRDRRVPNGARPHAREAEALVEPTGSPAPARTAGCSLAVPSKGRMAQPALELCADAGLASRRPTARCSCPCANAPSTCCSCAPTTSPSTSRTGSSTSGSPARTSSSRPPRMSSRSPSSASPAARCRRRCRRTRRSRRARSRRTARRHRVSGHDPDVAEAARDRGRARARLRLGRGCAEARPLRCDRRPRLDRLDRERERAPAARHAARVAGRPRRQPRRRSGSARSSSGGSS